MQVLFMCVSLFKSINLRIGEGMFLVKRIMLGILVVLVSLPILGAAYHQVISVRNKDRYPAPGVFVQTNDAKLHMVCKGQGTPTIFLDSGIGADATLTWKSLAEDLSKKTKTCYYDRAGYGWSEAPSRERTLENLVDDFTMLVSSEANGDDVILVAHSFSGPIIRTYAHRNPDNIVGMVFVDTDHEDRFKRFPAGSLPRHDDPLRKYGPYVGLGRLLASSFIPPQVGLDEAERQRYAEQWSHAKYHNAVISEGVSAMEAGGESLEGLGYNFKGIPLVVLSQSLVEEFPDYPEFVEFSKIWADLQRELAGLSDDTTHITLDNVGHNIPNEQPNAVIDAVKLLLER